MCPMRNWLLATSRFLSVSLKYKRVTPYEKNSMESRITNIINEYSSIPPSQVLLKELKRLTFPVIIVSVVIVYGWIGPSYKIEEKRACRESEPKNNCKVRTKHLNSGENVSISDKVFPNFFDIICLERIRNWNFKTMWFIGLK